MKTLHMVVMNGLFIMGELKGNLLHKPRTFTIIKDGREMQLSPLPFTPAFITLTNAFFSYPIPISEENIYSLYDRVTDPEKIKKAQEEAERGRVQQEKRIFEKPKIITGIN